MYFGWFSRVNGGLFGVIEGLFGVIRTFFGCFCERVCRCCARGKLLQDEELGEICGFGVFFCAHGLAG